MMNPRFCYTEGKDISPILMIAMENKTCPDSTLKDNPGKPHLLRIQEWDDLDKSRTGFYPHSFEPGFGYDSVADVILHKNTYIHNEENMRFLYLDHATL